MRILLFNLVTDVDDPILGFTTRWIRALAKRVEFIHVITMRAGRIEVPENVRVYSVGKERGYSEGRRALEFYRLLLRVLREDHIDICFSHMIPIFTILAAPVLKAKRIPMITWYAHPSLKSVLKLAHYFSDRMVTSVATAYPYKRDKLTPIGQGIDTDLFSPDGSASSPPDLPMILCVGRLSPVKNHLTLIEAACLLRRGCGKPFRMVILGGPGSPRDKSYISSLHDRVKRLELQECVYFEPPAPMVDLPVWYRRCTVHVNLTPTGFGDKVAWEAMACGKPSLVANEGFLETLGYWSDRLLFRYGNSEDLAQKLESILNMPGGTYQTIGQYLREQVVQMHDLKRLADRLVGLFESLKR